MTRASFVFVSLVLTLFLSGRDFFYLSPSIDLNFLSPPNEYILNRSNNLIGSDFLFYFRAGVDSLLGLNVSSIDYRYNNAGMLWLYPPPLIHFFELSAINNNPKIFLTFVLSLFLLLLHFFANAITRSAGSLFSFDGRCALLVYGISFIGWPVFNYVAVSNMNLGTILVLVAAFSLLNEDPKWYIYRASIFLLSFTKPQYSIFLLIRSFVNRKLDHGDFTCFFYLGLAHALAYFLFTEHYIRWLQIIQHYALSGENNGLWILSMVLSDDPGRMVLGFATLTILIVIFLNSFRFLAIVPDSRYLFAFTIIYFLIPRIYEYEIFLLPMLVALLCVRFQDKIGAVSCWVLLLVGLIYRAVSISNGGNFYTPAASQLFLIGFLLILCRLSLVHKFSG